MVQLIAVPGKCGNLLHDSTMEGDMMLFQSEPMLYGYSQHRKSPDNRNHVGDFHGLPILKYDFLVVCYHGNQYKQSEPQMANIEYVTKYK